MIDLFIITQRIGDSSVDLYHGGLRPVKVDVYDTYATDPNGGLLHFDSYVPAGTLPFQVERLVHSYVGGVDPEIELECAARNVSAAGGSVMIDLKSQRFSAQPLTTDRRAA